MIYIYRCIYKIVYMISKMLRNTRHRASIRALMCLLGLARYCFDSVLGRLEHWLDGVLDWPMYLKIAGIGVQNEAWRDRKSMKMVAWRVGNRGKWWFGRVLEGLGAPLGIHVAIFWKFLQKLGRRWAQDGRNWRQVAPKMGHDSAKVGQDGAKMVSFRSTWEVLGWFWEHFWVIWAHGLDSEKH